MALSGRLLTTALLRRAARVTTLGQPCHQRHITLSSKPVTPIIITEARKYLMDMVGTFYKWTETGTFTISQQDQMLPMKSSQEECPLRRMQDSYQEVIIPLGQDAAFREKYITSLRGLRFGRLLEDLDTFAVWICYIHNQDPSLGQIMKSPLSTVTALVDRIELHNVSVSAFHDVKMCGHVSWVGQSSMEVTMTVQQEVEGTMQDVLSARFVMVSRNPQTKKAAVVNPLKPEGEQEIAMFELGQRNKALRQDKAKASLLKMAPNEQERNLIHNIFLETIDQQSGTFNIRVKPENSVWMEETKLKTMNICHPEQKNLYNKIFGGFLMRQAFELAWANAAFFCKSRPRVRVVDDIMFRRPVEVGSLLFFSSQIVYTEGAMMQVKVHAEVLDIMTKSRETTNDFYFVFSGDEPELPRVVPRTYAESMLHLDGMRHMRD